MTTTRKTRRRSTTFAKNLQAIAAQATTPAAAAPAAPSAENMGRGRLLGPSDIEVLLGRRHTVRWIVRNFAPASRRKVGRRPCWFEADAIAWIDAQTDGGA